MFQQECHRTHALQRPFHFILLLHSGGAFSACRATGKGQMMSAFCTLILMPLPATARESSSPLPPNGHSSQDLRGPKRLWQTKASLTNELAPSICCLPWQVLLFLKKFTRQSASFALTSCKCRMRLLLQDIPLELEDPMDKMSAEVW